MIGGEKVILNVIEGKAHTDGDMYIYLPARKTLFAGDLIFNDRLPSLRDGSISGWITTLEAIKAMDLKVIVGGHGICSDGTSPDFTLNYLKALKEGVRTVLDEGGDLSDAVASMPMSEYADVGMYDTMHKTNINITFQMLEWEDE